MPLYAHGLGVPGNMSVSCTVTECWAAVQSQSDYPLVVIERWTAGDFIFWLSHSLLEDRCPGIAELDPVCLSGNRYWSIWSGLKTALLLSLLHKYGQEHDISSDLKGVPKSRYSEGTLQIPLSASQYNITAKCLSLALITAYSLCLWAPVLLTQEPQGQGDIPHRYQTSNVSRATDVIALKWQQSRVWGTYGRTRVTAVRCAITPLLAPCYKRRQQEQVIPESSNRTMVGIHD